MSKSHQFEELVSATQYDELFLAKKDYNEHHDTGKYIKTCAHLLRNIINKTGNKILFYNLYGYDYITKEYKSLTLYDETFYQWNKFDQHICDCFEKGLEAIKNDNMLSISSKIVDNKVNFVLLCNNKEEIRLFRNQFKNSASFNLESYVANYEMEDSFDTALDNSITHKKDIEKFASELSLKTPHEYKKLLINIRYQKITFKHHKSYYIYYIRPRVFHKEFIGSLYLVVGDKLAYAALNQLSSFILEVFSETAIGRMKAFIRKEVLPELSGVWKNQLIEDAFGDFLLDENRKVKLKKKTSKLLLNSIEWAKEFYDNKEANIPSHGFQDYRIDKFITKNDISSVGFANTFDNNIALRIALTSICKYCVEQVSGSIYLKPAISKHILNYFILYIRNSGKDLSFSEVEDTICDERTYFKAFFTHLGLKKVSNRQMIREEKLSPFEKELVEEVLQSLAKNIKQ